MKQFLTRLTIFLLSTIFIAGACYFINNLLIKSDDFKTEDSSTTLIIGDSHAKSSLNPKIIKNTTNVAMGAETYFTTYHKLKYILEKNSNIENVVLAFAPHNFSTFNDYKFYEPKRMMHTFNASNVLLDYKDIVAELPVNTSGFYRSFFRDRVLPNTDYIKNRFRVKSKREYPYIGGFYKSDRSKVKDNIELRDKTIGRHYEYNEKPCGVSRVAEKYFNKIVDLTREKNIKLILYTSPVHPLYKEKVPQIFLDNFGKLQSQLSTKNHVVLLDFLDRKMEDEFFGDFDHLNGKGAKIISGIVNDTLQQTVQIPN